MASLPAKQGNSTKQNKSQLHEVSGVVTLFQACVSLSRPSLVSLAAAAACLEERLPSFLSPPTPNVAVTEADDYNGHGAGGDGE